MGVYRPNPTVETVDGSTEVKNVDTIKVSNGDLTVTGRTATVDTSGSGSATLTRYMIGYGDVSNTMTGNARFLQTATDTISLGEPALTGALTGAPRLIMAGDTSLISTYSDNASSGDQISGLRVLSDAYRSGGMMIMDYDNTDGSTTERVLFGRQYGSSNKFGISESPENGGDEIFTVDTNTNQISINGDSNDYDTYIRGDSASEYTKWDAGTGVVTFQKVRMVIVSDDSIQPALQLYESNDDAGAGPRLYFRRDSGSPANFDDLGSIAWYGSVDDGGSITNDKQYANIYAETRSVVKDAQSGIIRYYAMYDGTSHEYMRMDEKKCSIGYNSGSPIDLQVYNNDSSARLLYVDASEDRVAIMKKIESKTADFSISSSQCYGDVFTMTSGSNEVFTLPASTEGMSLRVIRLGSGTVQVTPNGSENINGANSTVTISTQYQVADLVCYSDGEWILSLGDVPS